MAPDRTLTRAPMLASACFCYRQPQSSNKPIVNRHPGRHLAVQAAAGGSRSNCAACKEPMGSSRSKPSPPAQPRAPSPRQPPPVADSSSVFATAPNEQYAGRQPGLARVAAVAQHCTSSTAIHRAQAAPKPTNRLRLWQTDGRREASKVPAVDDTGVIPGFLRTQQAVIGAWS
jgi:hypothetical protein